MAQSTQYDDAMNKANLDLRNQIDACEICKEFLPLGPRPIVQFSEEARLLIIGQAPGRKVHETGIPWDDPSGKLLRQWLHLEEEAFYDPSRVALLPMGFCYPGKGKSGDLPPRKECAPQWHEQVLNSLPNLQLTILIGSYAQSHYLKGKAKGNLTETVKCFTDFLPSTVPLPHPSPRNRPWLSKNPWFEELLLPELQRRMTELAIA